MTAFPNMNQFAEFLQQFNEESSRGVVLTSAAYLDTILENTLLAFLIEDHASEMLVSEGNAPLQTFGGRIRACYALGLIREVDYQVLDIVRRIRNEFAHNWRRASFNNQQVRDLINNLPSIGHDELDNDPDARYKMNIAQMMLSLERNVDRIRANRRQRA